MFKPILLGLIAWLVMSAGSAWALTSDPTSPPAMPTPFTELSARDRNLAVLAKAAGAERTFQVLEDGRVLHIQSDAVCPASLSGLALWHLEVFQPDGSDVGCDYGRSLDGKSFTSKLTIFYVKSGSTTLDQAFDRYKDEIEKGTPGARYSGPALTIDRAGGPDPFGEFRSAEYYLMIGEKPFVSDLIVAVRQGWIVEVRGTFSAEVAVQQKGFDASNTAAAVADMATPPMAFLAAVKSLSKD